MGKAAEVTEEILGKKPKYVESDKEKEIQSAITDAMQYMDDNPMIRKVEVSLSAPYRKFVETMFPGIENVAGGIVASSVNSLHIQIVQPANHPRVAHLRQKLFKCDLDFVFTDTDGFHAFLLPLRDKSIKKDDDSEGVGLESNNQGEVFTDTEESDGPMRLAVSMSYDLSKSYKEQIEKFQKETLDLIQQFCTLRENVEIVPDED